MKNIDIIKIRKKLEKALDNKRFEHTLGVEYTACALAMVHGADVRKAQVAGLLHDCAKCISNKKKIAICEKHNIKFTELERRNPFLLHAKLGGFLAKDKYGIADNEIIEAIINHTTGKPDMSLLDKIVFIADYIEPNRKQLPDLDECRRLAFIDIDQALIKILEDTLTYLKSSGNEMDPMTQDTYNYYCKKEKK